MKLQSRAEQDPQYGHYCTDEDVDGPVEIEALTDEAEAIEQSSLRVAVIDLYLPDDLEPRRIVLEADAPDKLATENPMDQLLVAARPIQPIQRTSVSNGSRQRQS